MRFVIALMFLLPKMASGQSAERDTLFQHGGKVEGQTFDLKFHLRVLPDNGWYLELHKDATFEYIHWSGWGDDKGTILDCGTYSVVGNRLKLESKGAKGSLPTGEFYITSAEIAGEVAVDCADNEKVVYCLYRL